MCNCKETENLQDIINSLVERDEYDKISVNVEREIRMKLIKETAQALGLFIYDDRVEFWVEDPEFINGGYTTIYYKQQIQNINNDAHLTAC